MQTQIIGNMILNYSVNESGVVKVISIYFQGSPKELKEALDQWKYLTEEIINNND